MERVSDPLEARGKTLPASVGSAPTWSESLVDIRKNANLTLSYLLLERAVTVYRLPIRLPAKSSIL